VGVVIRSFLAQQGLRNSTCFPLDLLPDDNRLDGPEGKLDDRPPRHRTLAGQNSRWKFTYLSNNYVHSQLK
jgi:hypothetical protein